MPKAPGTILVKATGLADAWAQLIPECLKEGMIIDTQYGNRSIDVCAVTEIIQPYLEPMLHPQFPTGMQHCAEYMKQWGRDYDWIKQQFEYTYGDRIFNYPIPDKECNGLKFEDGRNYYNHSDQGNYFIDQMARVREMLKNGVSRRIQALTWIPARDLFVQEDQPCLQRLWFRPLGNGNIEMHCMWRSRDLHSAWNSNMLALLMMVKKEILEPNNMKLIKVIDFCNALHIYEAEWEEAKKVKGVPKNPQTYGRII